MSLNEKHINNPLSKSKEDWKKELSEEEYRVLREKGTELPFRNKYYMHKENGEYTCAGCGSPLFSSEHKYDSGSGWPAFYDLLKAGTVKEIADKSHGMIRTEVVCANCEGHLGHVFPDGPKPTGMRYCINSISLDFKKKEI